MAQATARLAVYSELVWMQIRAVLMNRASYLLTFIGLLLHAYILRMVWAAIYGRNATLADVPLEITQTYVTLTAIQIWILYPATFSVIPERVNDGAVETDMLRPVGFIGQVVARQAGLVGSLLPFVPLAAPFLLLGITFTAPDSAYSAVLFAISMCLALILALIISALIGMTAFWWPESMLLLAVFRTFLQAFGGASIPLWAMPQWLAPLAYALPFQATIYTPAAIYVGRLEGPRLLGALAVQVCWIATVGLVTALVWAKVQKRLRRDGPT